MFHIRPLIGGHYSIVLVCVALTNHISLAREALWIEGEDYSSSSFNRHGWYQNSNIQKDLLSPGEPGGPSGAWHCHYSSSGNPATATYTFTIEEGGQYTWWIRLNPFRNKNGGAQYSYRYHSTRSAWTQWQTLDVSEARDSMIDLVDPGIDIRFIAWSFGDNLQLSKGDYELQIRLSPGPGDEENHGGIDVLAFVNFPWAPTGITPPQTETPPAKPGDWFTLMAGPDAFSPDSITDMSHLFEKPAGGRGFVQRQGDSFVFQDGTPVKFWGINASMTETVEGQEQQARFYAKHGINMVRQHPVQSVLGSLERHRNTWRFNPERLDQWDRWFSILKENGIYMTWSIFYHHVVLPDEGIDPLLYQELPPQGAGRDCYGMATFIEEYQDSQWRYARLLLEHVNPYTGLAYKDDPALALVEARNEDSVFFHNPLGDGFVRGLDKPHHGARLKTMWQQWVKNRYQNNTAIAQAWRSGLRTTTTRNGDGSIRSRPDSVNETKMYIYAAWEMEKDGPNWRKTQERRRLGDFIQFLAEMQRSSYLTYQQRLRDLGYQAVVVSTAWKAGGPAASAANLWTDDALEAIDRHNYSGGGAGGHNITIGNVNNDTHLDKPGRAILSSGLWQVEDKPFIMTEWTQKPPNQWKAEITPLMAFYGMGLQGWDALYHFAGSRSMMGNGWPSMRSYVTETPHYLGQFPALARAVYWEHIEEGALTAARRLATAEAFTGTDILDQTYGQVGYDENELLAQGDTPVEALAIGRVTLKLEDGQPPSQAASLTPGWNKRRETVSSNTGQLTWDYGNRVVSIHSEKTQGVVGFALGRAFDLPGVHIDNIETRFISLLFTPLDNHSLVASKHILITALAQDKQLGTVYNSSGTELLEAGGPPLLLEPVQATITMKGPSITQVRVVDVQGVPTDQNVEREGNSFRIDGRYATYYYEVRRD